VQLRRKCFRYANSKLVDLAVLERNNRTITTMNRLREIDASIKNTLMTLSQVAQYVCPTLLVYGNTTVMSVIEHDVQTTSLKPLITHTQLCVFIRYQ
jgi:hypothetical protein